MNQKFVLRASFAAAIFVLTATTAFPAPQSNRDNDDEQGNNNSSACSGLPGYTALKSALDSAVAAETSGLNLNMWATVVDRDGVVCAVAFSGINRGAQWPGSR